MRRTTGYRAEHTVFEQTAAAGRRARPGRLRAGRGAGPRSGPGPIEQTGNPLDLALDGDGYLSFATPAGRATGAPGGSRSIPDGRLVERAGPAAARRRRQPDHAAGGRRSISIAGDGTVAGRTGPIARIGIVGFAHEQALDRTGDGLLATSEPAVPATGTRVVQGALEGSNVQPVTGDDDDDGHRARVRGHAAADRHRARAASGRRSSGSSVSPVNHAERPRSLEAGAEGDSRPCAR